MAIKGRTDALPIPGQMLPEIGRFYKGSPQIEKTRSDGTKYKIVGRDLDYFRVEFNPQFASLSLLWREMYKDKPTVFNNVWLAGGETVDEVFPTWYESHRATKMLARCDGENILRWFNEKKGTYSEQKKPCDGAADEMNEWHCSLDCGAIGRLNLILKDFCIQAGVFGYFRISIGSYHEIDKIIFPALASAYVTFGRLKGIPFTFGRANREINMRNRAKDAKPGDRINVTKSLCFIEVDKTFMKMVLLPEAFGDSPGLIEAAKPLALPDEITEVDAQIIEDNTASWDVQQVCRVTSGLFQGGPDEQSAFIDDLLARGVLTLDMPTEQVIVLVRTNWISDPQDRPGWQNKESVKKFFDAALKIGLSSDAVLQALNVLTGAQDVDSPALQRVEDFAGSKRDAWAACLAWAVLYEPAAELPGKVDDKTRQRVGEIITLVKAVVRSELSKNDAEQYSE